MSPHIHEETWEEAREAAAGVIHDLRSKLRTAEASRVERKPGGPFLHFPPDPTWAPTHKTKRFRVASVRDGSVLGNVQWFPHWRRYVFAPIEGTIFDRVCLREIEQFIYELMQRYATDTRGRDAAALESTAVWSCRGCGAQLHALGSKCACGRTDRV